MLFIKFYTINGDALSHKHSNYIPSYDEIVIDYGNYGEGRYNKKKQDLHLFIFDLEFKCNVNINDLLIKTTQLINKRCSTMIIFYPTLNKSGSLFDFHLLFFTNTRLDRIII